MSGGSRLDLLLEQLCPSSLHDDLDRATYTTGLCHFAAEYVHLTEGSAARLSRDAESDRRGIHGRMAHYARNTVWCYLELLEYCLRIQIY